MVDIRKSEQLNWRHILPGERIRRKKVTCDAFGSAVFQRHKTHTSRRKQLIFFREMVLSAEGEGRRPKKIEEKRDGENEKKLEKEWKRVEESERERKGAKKSQKE